MRKFLPYCPTEQNAGALPFSHVLEQNWGRKGTFGTATALPGPTPSEPPALSHSAVASSFQPPAVAWGIPARGF